MKPIILLIALSLMLLGTTQNAHAQTRQADSLALVMLYDSTGGANWTTTWDLTMPLDSFYGVTLDSNGRVKLLELLRNNLVGGVPDLNLSRLKTLSLPFNKLSGSIPDFTALPILNTLDLYDNELSGSIPDFSSLPDLQRLWLHNNQLTGSIPDFSNLPRLVTLYLHNNQLTGTIPNFSNTPILFTLWIQYNQLNGNVPSFSNTPRMSILHLDHNQLSGSIPNFNLPNLDFLYLQDNQLSGSIPNFNNLPDLRGLYLNENQLSGTLPAFNDLLDLRALWVGDNQLNGTIPDFSNSPDLFGLHLSNNQFTFEDFLSSYDSLTSQITRLSDFRYATQDSIGTTQIINAALGANYTIDLVIDDTVTTNTYYWYKDGILIDSVVGVNEYTINNFQAGDRGIYSAAVKNSIVTNANSSFRNLVLYSHSVTLNYLTTVNQIAVYPLQVHPNPVQEVLYINTATVQGTFAIQIIDQQGRVVKQLTGEGNTLFMLPMAELPAGLYIVRLQQANQVWQEKVIKG